MGFQISSIVTARNVKFLFLIKDMGKMIVPMIRSYFSLRQSKEKENSILFMLEKNPTSITFLPTSLDI